MLALYGAQVMNGVLEEKSSRIVELIISTVRPFELLMGKLLGIGAVGFTQVAIWATTAFVMTAPGMLVALSWGTGRAALERLPAIEGKRAASESSRLHTAMMNTSFGRRWVSRGRWPIAPRA